ncbi:hypothetical protein DM01DRAFT_1344733 [Hesseltinella vesiculosa]|uniref:FAS1 domain-containing protein n=1 Tax=Hesseltinella vesiculosa TaxID=101127 RepID=A0A1X2GMC3_9FUNG|nr:hypothetical protein DM01DRAFT_1344733 [Hesseltinella vesiculosa]
MMFGKKLAVVTLLAVAGQTAAQTGNITLLDTLRSSKTVSQFAILIEGCQPLADALAGAGDMTVFAPSDSAMGKFIKSAVGTKDVSCNTMTNMNRTLLDILWYQVAGQAVLLKDVQPSQVVNTLLNNNSVDNFPNGVPLLVEAIPGKKKKNTTYEVSNGLSGAKITDAKGIQASNGVVHYTDQVLRPPATLEQTLKQVGGKGFQALASGQPQLLQQWSDMKEVTLLIPKKMKKMKAPPSNGTSAVNPYAMNYVVQGIYYTSNMTGILTQLTNYNGHTISVNGNETTGDITLNNNVTIVKPNIIYEGGVIHIISGPL